MKLILSFVALLSALCSAAVIAGELEERQAVV